MAIRQHSISAKAINKNKYPRSWKLRKKSWNSLKRLRMSRYLINLENGCRIFKQSMIAQSNKNAEQLFYRFELISRREQISSKNLEWAISKAYDIVSEYGFSIHKPQIYLFAIVMPVFSIFYWILEYLSLNDIRDILSEPAAGRNWENALRALSASCSRIFPFGAFEEVSKNFASNVNGEGHPFLSFIYMLSGTTESFIAILLAFLSGLAIRRRFQIN